MQLIRRATWWVVAGCVLVAPTWGAVLPEDRVDAMLHYYDGGGTKVSGPALLVRKGVGDQTSIYASYYTDSISGASIDIVTTASPYKEKRDERAVGIDFLHRNTTVNLSYTNSDERDYLANTLGLNIAHEVFDGLTTISLGYTIGRDEVGKVNTSFKEDVTHYRYRLGISQVFTKSFLMTLDYEGILDTGYLNSPYRAARLQGLLVPERYPGTRDSYAIAVRAVKGLTSDNNQLNASLRFGYRYFSDTWNIHAHTLEAAYQRRLSDRWTIEPHYRYYWQSAASFYADNFNTAMVYMARDKELSTFKSHALGAKASFGLFEQRFGAHKTTLNFSYDYMRFLYDDFTDMRTGAPYRFNANVYTVFISAWF